MNLSLIGLYSVLPTTVPYIGLGAIGIYFAVARRVTHPRVSLLASLGFICLIINVLGHAGLTIYMISNGANLVHRTAFALWYGLTSAALELVDLGGLALLAVAIFIDRKTKRGDA